MKILYMLLISLFLQADCYETDAKNANALFYEASETKVVSKQMALLALSLELCFTYEVEYSLLTLQAEQEEDKEKKLELYDRALESVSQIKSNDALVKSEQSKINRIIGEIHKKEKPLLSDIYKKKADAQNEVKERAEQNYLFWIVSLVALLLWASWDLLKKWGKF